MPIPIAGKARNLTIIMPTISGSCCPNPFKPEKYPIYALTFIFKCNYYTELNPRYERQS